SPTVPGAHAAPAYPSHCVGNGHANTWETPWEAEPDTLDPAAYPESIWMWEHGKVTALPRPYYGFQQGESVMGHGPWMWGEYRNWLAREHPAENARFQWKEAERPVPGLDGCMRLSIPPELHYNAWIADRTIAAL